MEAVEVACVGCPCHSGRSRSLEHPRCQVAEGAVSLVGEELGQTSSEVVCDYVVIWWKSDCATRPFVRCEESDEYETTQESKIEMYLGSWEMDSRGRFPQQVLRIDLKDSK